MKRVVLWLNGLLLASFVLSLILLSIRGARAGGSLILLVPYAAAWAALYFGTRRWFVVAAFLANALMAVLAGLWFVLLQQAEQPESSSPLLLRMMFLTTAVVSIVNVVALRPHIMRKTAE